MHAHVGMNQCVPCTGDRKYWEQDPHFPDTPLQNTLRRPAKSTMAGESDAKYESYRPGVLDACEALQAVTGRDNRRAGDGRR